MSEESLAIDTESAAPDIVVPETQGVALESTPKVATVEDKAKEAGWVPKEEYKGDPADWRSAEVFLERGPLMDRIKKLNKDMEKLVDLSENSEKKAKQAEINAYNKYQQELQQLRQQAIYEGNAQAIDAISQDIQRVDFERFQAAQSLNAPDQSVVEFIQKHEHTWLNDKTPLNSSMKAFAISCENDIRARNPSLPLNEVLQQVEKEVVNTFPQVFPGKSKPAPVMGSSVSERGDSHVGHTFHDLPEAAKPIFRMIENIKKKAKQSYTVKDFIETYGTFHQEKR